MYTIQHNPLSQHNTHRYTVHLASSITHSIQLTMIRTQCDLAINNASCTLRNRDAQNFVALQNQHRF